MAGVHHGRHLTTARVRDGSQGRAGDTLPPECQRDASNACSTHVVRERKTPKHNRCFRSGGRGKLPPAAGEKYRRAIGRHVFTATEPDNPQT